MRTTVFFSCVCFTVFKKKRFVHRFLKQTHRQIDSTLLNTSRKCTLNSHTPSFLCKKIFHELVEKICRSPGIAANYGLIMPYVADLYDKRKK